MDKFTEQIKTYYTNAKKNRYKILPSGYKIDRWLMQFGMWLFFFIAFMYVYNHNYDLDYYECVGGDPLYMRNGVEYCKNPFYVTPSWKNTEYLTIGSYGTPKTQMFQFICILPIIIFGIMGPLNHLVHNTKNT